VSELADRALTELRAAFAAAADPERAVAMAAYMKNHFAFFGIPAPQRRQLQRAAWASSANAFRLPKRLDSGDLIAILDGCWAQPEREFQYAGMELLDRQIAYCEPGMLSTIERLIQTKSWWDTIDDLCRHSAGGLVRRFPELRGEMDRWSASGELWLIRSAILHQEMWRDEMDIDWIEATCLRHASHRDFFVRKAIGWALRSYAHRGPATAARVRGFLAEHDHELSPLSTREALKRVRH
jgi:3-methyladenine DNA glycosylase AlkD